MRQIRKVSFVNSSDGHRVTSSTFSASKNLTNKNNYFVLCLEICCEYNAVVNPLVDLKQHFYCIKFITVAFVGMVPFLFFLMWHAIYISNCVGYISLESMMQERVMCVVCWNRNTPI